MMKVKQIPKGLIVCVLKKFTPAFNVLQALYWLVWEKYFYIRMSVIGLQLKVMFKIFWMFNEFHSECLVRFHFNKLYVGNFIVW